MTAYGDGGFGAPQGYQPRYNLSGGSGFESRGNGYDRNGSNRRGGRNDDFYNSGYSGAPPQNINVKKNFYIEDPMIAAAKPEQVADFRKMHNNIMVFTSNASQTVPNPVIDFRQAFGCDPLILEAIEHQKFDRPTPIQCQTWPILLSGYDCISISQTGSGKTIGFLLPGLVHSHGQTDPAIRNDSRSPNILIISPTRELAIQTHMECEKYKYRDYRSACVYGGASKGPQLGQLRSGVKIIIGTPGRINDFVEMGALDLSKITYLVLDEADRMLDMGFEPQIKKIIARIPTNRQTVMTSATWPESVKALARNFLVDPIQINIGDLELNASKTIKQIIELDYETETAKMDHMIHTMRSEPMRSSKVLVFCNTKRCVDQLNHSLRSAGFRSTHIHGDRDQRERETALNNLKLNYCNILVATDVAARGLDIAGVDFVINFDMANNIEEYVHRVGRTGRAGREGCAITYFSRSNSGMAKELIDILKKAEQHVDPRLYQYQGMPSSNRSHKSKYSGGGGRFGGSDRGYSGSRGSFGGGFRRERW